MALLRQPILTLDPSLGSKKDLAKIRDNLSAIVLGGDHLWLGGDEGTQIDRMIRDGSGNFGSHRRFDLAPLIELPVSDGSEIDIEGLDVDSGYLWLTGSHSLKRKKPEDDKPPDKNRERLAKIESDGNRYTLARVPLDANHEPVKKSGALKAARLEGDDKGNQLTRALRNDPHIGPFFGIPSKDNGIDIEGLAVQGDRAFLGMRGPVLRGWAVVLDIQLKGSLSLAGPVKKHFLQLDGLGVREISIQGKDLIILAGPTMDLDGPVHIYRWPKALDTAGEALVSRKDLKKLIDVPFGAGRDHAEGISIKPSEVMICYDSPADTRLVGDNAVRADVFAL